jgi:hypothetical protein
MNRRIAASVGLVLIAILSGCAAPVKTTIDPAARTVPGGRDVRVIVEQREIQTRIVESNLTAAAGGGLLFALIDVGVNQSRANTAEKAVVPVRDALLGYDFDGKVAAANRAALARYDWLGLRDVSFAKDVTPGAQLAALDASTADQVVFATYDYAVAADFASIEVTMGVAVANRAGVADQPPEARLKPQNLAYKRVFKSVQPLDQPDKEAAPNAQRWASDGGRLARAAIDRGIERVHWMLDRSLAQTPDEAAAVSKGPNGQAGAYAGKRVETTPYGELVEVLLPINMWVLADAPVR